MTKPILRPNFTKNIHQHYIQKGKSLNIFGAKGVGKSRFIEDLKLLIDSDTNFISLNMRELRTNYKKFTQKLKEELGIEGEANTIELVLADFVKKSGKKVLVIDHFEYLFEANHDRAFNFDFFDQLNSFKNDQEVSLVILSTRNYQHYHFYKGSEQTTSPLDIEVMEITSMLHKEIENEFKRRINITLNFKKLASMVMGSKYSYSLIEFIIREIAFGRYNTDDFLEQNFDRWEEQFHKENGISTILKAKNSVTKWNFSALGGFIIKAIKEWKKD